MRQMKKALSVVIVLVLFTLYCPDVIRAASVIDATDCVVVPDESLESEASFDEEVLPEVVSSTENENETDIADSDREIIIDDFSYTETSDSFIERDVEDYESNVTELETDDTEPMSEYSFYESNVDLNCVDAMDDTTESNDLEVYADENEITEDTVGAGRIDLGNGVSATWDSKTGAVAFYSSGGTLSSKWKDRFGASNIKSVRVASGKVYLPANSESLFSECSNLVDLNLNGFDTSRVTKMDFMFCWCDGLKNLDLKGFNTNKVQSMRGMFDHCLGLTSLDLRSFNTVNTVDMSGMFGGCSDLKTVDLSSFSTSNVKDMNSMFAGCADLIKLDLSGFDTRNVTDMFSMFYVCESLVNLDLGNFRTSKVTDMHNMFFDCERLINLDLSNFNTSRVTDMHNMFGWCSSLANLNLSSFDITKANCNSLLDKCSGIQTLRTPKDNNRYNIRLPFSMYDSTGSVYNSLPLLSKSIILTRTQNVKVVSISNALVKTKSSSYAYTGLPRKPAPTVSFSGKTLAAGRDYAVSYKNNTNVGTATVTVEGRGYYKGTAKATFKITRRSIANASVKTKSGTYDYKGYARRPIPVVRIGSRTLENEKDFKVSYKNNTNAGTATVYVTGIGSYTGTKMTTFKIDRSSITKAKITTKYSSYPITGKARCPKPIVKIGGRVLVNGKDYTVSYRNNVKVGTAVIIIKGKGNYFDTAVTTFKLVKATVE